jgi:hypothetical protein
MSKRGPTSVGPLTAASALDPAARRGYIDSEDCEVRYEDTR